MPKEISSKAPEGAVYLETSALLSWMLGEANAEEVERRIHAAETVLTSTLTFLEAERALIRAAQQKVITVADRLRLSGRLKKLRNKCYVMQMDESVQKRVDTPFPIEPTSTLVALHLATALEWLEAYPHLEVLSLDHHVIENTEALGLPLGIMVTQCQG